LTYREERWEGPGEGKAFPDPLPVQIMHAAAASDTIWRPWINAHTVDERRDPEEK
jgi:hypothetical protein